MASIPFCVQQVTWPNSNESGNNFLVELIKENTTLASNCLLLMLFYPSSATLSSITETNAGTPNTWSVTPIGTATDSGNGVTISVFAVFGANAGAAAFTVAFSAAVGGFSAAFCEWGNIATSGALDVAAVTQSITLSAANPVITSGELTTVTDGDLIIQIGWNSDNGPGSGGGSGFLNGLTDLIPQTPGFKFLQADLNYGYFFQYWVQPKAGGVNPGVAVQQNPAKFPSTWESITIALKSASAGTARSSTAQYVFGMKQSILNGNGLTTGNVVPFKFPTVGNQFVLACDDPFSSIAISAVNGIVSGPWQVVSSSGADAQGAFKAGGALSGNNEVLQVSLNDTAGHGYAFVVAYDTVNGGAFDKSQHNDSSTTTGPGNLTPTVSFTPVASAGMVYHVTGMPTGPSSGINLPAGASFLSPTYTGQTDTSGLSNGDLHGTFKYTTNAAQTWQDINSVSTNGYDMLNMSFTLGPIITTPPQNQTTAPGGSVTFSVSATASGGSLSYQWFRIAPGNAPYSAGSSISGATSSSYTFTPNYQADVGAMWYCAVTDSNATVNSGTPAQVIFQVESYLTYVQPQQAAPIAPQFGNLQLNHYEFGEDDFASDLNVKFWF